MAGGGLVSTVVTSWMCLRHCGQARASFTGAIKQIKNSTSVFIYKSSSNIVTVAATSILGGVAGASAVAVFGPADKVIKAVTGLALPVLNALYPHLSRLFVEDNTRTGRRALFISAVIFSTGLLAAITLTVIGPALMEWLLGPGYDTAGALLSVMVWLIPLRLGNQALGFTLLLPAGLEHRASLSMLFSSLASLTLGGLFAINYGALGMVWGVLIGESLLLIAQLYTSRQMIRQEYQ
jgi:PST family polysaccharide transporter